MIGHICLNVLHNSDKCIPLWDKHNYEIVNDKQISYSSFISNTWWKYFKIYISYIFIVLDFLRTALLSVCICWPCTSTTLCMWKLPLTVFTWTCLWFFSCCSGTLKREKRAFSRLVLDIAYSFFLPPFSFQIRVGGLYLLYGLYQCQTASPPEQVRI